MTTSAEALGNIINLLLVLEETGKSAFSNMMPQGLHNAVRAYTCKFEPLTTDVLSAQHGTLPDRGLVHSSELLLYTL